MTIPELEAEIRGLRDGMNQLDEEKRRLSDDLNELRSQLGLERMPHAICESDARATVNIATPRRF